MGVRGHKKGLALVAGFLFLMGVVVPAAFGLLTEKAMDLGTADLLDKSTNWDSSNIANSTYFTLERVWFGDNQTGNFYELDQVYDSDNDLDETLADASGTVAASMAYASDIYDVWVSVNKTAFDNVDKIVVLFRILDTGGQDLNGTIVRISLQSGTNGKDYSYKIGEWNASDAVNSTLRVEIPIDAIKRLNIQSSSLDPTVYIFMSNPNGGGNLDGVVIGYRVELYNVKKVNASSAANIMLVSSGILGWVGALAATPYWNPMSNPNHRNVRGAVRRVRRIRRRR